MDDMADAAQSIELNLAEKLRNPEYRRAFFRAEASAEIARQLIELRKRRDLTQAQLAVLANTGQPAISRYERADYQNWTMATLRSITDALDGRLRVIIEAAEDVLPNYAAQPEEPKANRFEERAVRGRGIDLPKYVDTLRATPQAPSIERTMPFGDPIVDDPQKHGHGLGSIA